MALLETVSRVEGSGRTGVLCARSLSKAKEDAERGGFVGLGGILLSSNGVVIFGLVDSAIELSTLLRTTGALAGLGGSGRRIDCCAGGVYTGGVSRVISCGVSRCAFNDANAREEIETVASGFLLANVSVKFLGASGTFRDLTT